MPDGRPFVLPPPAIQGIGNAGGFQMQLELLGGGSDYKKLGNLTDQIFARRPDPSLARVLSTYRTNAPEVTLFVDRDRAETLRVSAGDIFSTLTDYVGSTYVNQFNKFGQSLQVYVQADLKYRLHPEDLLSLYVRSQDGQMVPIGAVAHLGQTVSPPLMTLYNLYPSSTIVGSAARGYSTGQAMTAMEAIAKRVLPDDVAYEWTAMSYQEKITGNQLYYVFGLSLLLVYLVLAGQYESWILPLAVLAAVPLALLGPVIALTSLGAANNLYTQIGLMLLIALSAQERHSDRRDGARAAHRPRQVDLGVGGRGLAAPLPPDPDDVFRLHPRRAAAGARDRRRRQRPPLARHQRVFRHDRLDLPRGAVRAVVLRRAAAVRGMAEGPEEAEGEGRGAGRGGAGRARGDGRDGGVTRHRASRRSRILWERPPGYFARATYKFVTQSASTRSGSAA